MEYWNKQRFHKRHNASIDWKAQSRATKEVWPHIQRFVVKWSSNHIGTGANLVDWHMRRYGECPFCNKESEMTQHVVQCMNNKATDIWNEAVVKYDTALTKIGTSTMLKQIILKELNAWRFRDPVLHRDRLPYEQQILIQEQKQIGWKNFLKGLIST